MVKIAAVSALPLALAKGRASRQVQLGGFNEAAALGEGGAAANFMEGLWASNVEVQEDLEDSTQANIDAGNVNGVENFNHLLGLLQLDGVGGDEPCPILPDLQSGGTAGFAGAGCAFPSFGNSSNFNQVFTDCHGNALPAGQEWYSSVHDFPGKENAMWYAPTGFYDYPNGIAQCAGPVGSHMWCPNSDLENQWMWHHHPDQPFTPYPSTKGLYTGIARPERTSNDYFCDTDRYVQTYFDWGVDEPHLGKNLNTMLYYMSHKMMDLRGGVTGSVLCEINCDQLRTCEALNCDAIGATCTDNGTVESSECVCNDNTHVWDRDAGTCGPPDITYNIPAGIDGMKVLLESVFSDGEARKRRRRAIDAVFDDIMSHGCHCVKMDKDFTGLGGRTTVDTLDGLCQSWTQARRCITLQGGSCENRDLSIDTYQVTINPITKEMNCTINDNNGSDQCLKDNCYIDTLNAQFILGELSNDPSWTPVAGTSALCPKCNNCVPPAGCRGTAPNVETVSWLDFNQNGLAG